jgi:sulfite reductase (ferredoxin)
VGGGLGAQPYLAQVAHEFLEEDLIIPFTEGVIRVFDRYGERNRRNKARLKFLIEEIGFDTFLELVEKERIALKNKTYKINRDILPQTVPPAERDIPVVTVNNPAKYESG